LALRNSPEAIRQILWTNQERPAVEYCAINTNANAYSPVVRIWHGRTQRKDAAEYLNFLTQRALPDYRRTPGNLSVQILQSFEGDAAHFITLTHWDSIEAIVNFTGENDPLTAKYYPEDARYLLELEPFVENYVLAAAK
jgi:heme-degrading monooxygenase HmoA